MQYSKQEMTQTKLSEPTKVYRICYPFYCIFYTLPFKVLYLVSVIKMLNKAAQRLSLSLYDRNYISSDEIEWCIYVIEKLILQTIFLTLTFAWVAFTSSFIETLIPVSVFCYLRSKIGGYHAKHASICLLLSSLFVISCKLSVNALIEINPYIFWNSNLVVMSIGYILRPVYPSEAAVPVEDAEKNNISKKLLLALILLVQVLAELIKIRVISVCLFYGVIMAITSVIILKKEGRKNETH